VENPQQVIVVKSKRTGVIPGIIAGVLALLGIFSVGLVFVPLAILVALIGSIVAIKNFNIGGVGVNILSWVLIVVGIAVSPGIWVALALIGFQDSDLRVNHSIRTQVEEGVNITGGAKAAVSEFYYDTGTFPSSNAQAGLSPADTIVGRYVSNVSIAKNGGILVMFVTAASDPSISSGLLMFQPKDVAGRVEWECTATIEQSSLPDSCQSLLTL